MAALNSPAALKSPIVFLSLKEGEGELSIQEGHLIYFIHLIEEMITINNKKEVVQRAAPPPSAEDVRIEEARIVAELLEAAQRAEEVQSSVMVAEEELKRTAQEASAAEKRVQIAELGAAEELAEAAAKKLEIKEIAAAESILGEGNVEGANKAGGVQSEREALRTIRYYQICLHNFNTGLCGTIDTLISAFFYSLEKVLAHRVAIAGGSDEIAGSSDMVGLIEELLSQFPLSLNFIDNINRYIEGLPYSQDLSLSSQVLLVNLSVALGPTAEELRVEAQRAAAAQRAAVYFPFLGTEAVTSLLEDSGSFLRPEGLLMPMGLVITALGVREVYHGYITFKADKKQGLKQIAKGSAIMAIGALSFLESVPHVALIKHSVLLAILLVNPVEAACFCRDKSKKRTDLGSNLLAIVPVALSICILSGSIAASLATPIGWAMGGCFLLKGISDYLKGRSKDGAFCSSNSSCLPLKAALGCRPPDRGASGSTDSFVSEGEEKDQGYHNT